MADDRNAEILERRATLIAAWHKLNNALKGAAPKSERETARADYLSARAALESYGDWHVEFALSMCHDEGERRSWDSPAPDELLSSDPEGDYYASIRRRARDAESAVSLPRPSDGIFDRILEGGIALVGGVLGCLFRLAGFIVLLWAFIWVVKTLWYLA